MRIVVSCNYKAVSFSFFEEGKDSALVDLIMVPKKLNRVKNSSQIIFKDNDTIVFAFVLPKLKNVSVQAYM